MVDQTIEITIYIFSYAYLGYQALFAFDNSFNHSCFAKNTLLVGNVNLNLRKKQPTLRNEFNYMTKKV